MLAMPLLVITCAFEISGVTVDTSHITLFHTSHITSFETSYSTLFEACIVQCAHRVPTRFVPQLECSIQCSSGAAAASVFAGKSNCCCCRCCRRRCRRSRRPNSFPSQPISKKSKDKADRPKATASSCGLLPLRRMMALGIDCSSPRGAMPARVRTLILETQVSCAASFDREVEGGGALLRLRPAPTSPSCG
jgi:hypothetical protein